MNFQLEDALAPYGIDAVRQQMDARQVLHVRAPNPDRFKGLFSWEKIEEILADPNCRRADFKMYLAGKPVDMQLMGIFDKAGVFVGDRLRKLIAQGITLGGISLERSVPALAALAERTMSCYGGIARCAFVASYGVLPGYPAHFDCDDLLIMQIDGAKRWRFYGPPAAGSGFPMPDVEPRGELTETVDMHPGDFLLVPCGLRHQCVPLEPSLHIGIAINWPSGVWIARRVLEMATHQVLLREPLRPEGDPGALAELQDSVKRELALLVDTFDFASAYTEFQRRFSTD